jgi:hypothetical protein
MIRAILEEEEQITSSTQETDLPPQENSNTEDILKLLEILEAHKTCLNEQKERFSSLLAQLEIKGKEEVENRKRVIKKLNLEVSDLKRKCEKLLTIINAGTAFECKQAGV